MVASVCATRKQWVGEDMVYILAHGKSEVDCVLYTQACDDSYSRWFWSERVSFIISVAQTEMP